MRRIRQDQEWAYTVSSLAFLAVTVCNLLLGIWILWLTFIPKALPAMIALQMHPKPDELIRDVTELIITRLLAKNTTDMPL